jgi:hypothetical protein
MVNLPNLFKYLPSPFNTFNYLEKDSLALIEWFSCNQMKANPDKFQAIAIGKKSMDKNIVLDLAAFKKMLNSTGPRIDPCGTPL